MAPDEPTLSGRNPVRTRAAILAAARDLVLDAGQRLSIRHVAELAGVTHGTIYLYFRDKDDLLYQVAESTAHEIVARLRRLPRGIGADEQLRQTFLVLSNAALDAPDAFHFIFTLRPARATATPVMSPLAAVLEAPLVDAVAAVLADGDDIAPAIARALLLSIVGFVEAERAGITTRTELQAIADQTIVLIMAGLRVS
ncbi:MAG TPA: hypothetical protein DEU95_00515 [Chloroflexi bacterium]|nr:hypothetical protein [Chloroflexota bacterium]HCG28253.1 hypothetical protein [Chloroflexota bacterium]